MFCSAHANEDEMATYNALAALPGGEPGPWGEAVEISYDRRDVLLYAVGVGTRDLRFVYEGAPGFRGLPDLSHTLGRRWRTARHVPSAELARAAQHRRRTLPQDG